MPEEGSPRSRREITSDPDRRSWLVSPGTATVRCRRSDGRAPGRNPGAPFAFKISTIRVVLQFTRPIAPRCVRHRRGTRGIHRCGLYVHGLVLRGALPPPAGRPLAPEGFGAAACASLSLLATLAPEGFGWRRPRSWGPVRVDPHRDLWYDQPRERASFRSPSGVRGCSAVGRGFHTPTGIPGRRAPTLHRRRPTGSRRCPPALSGGLFLQPFPSRRASVLASRLCICICII